jgi:polar amino acid transport system substrate-binding protein
MKLKKITSLLLTCILIVAMVFTLGACAKDKSSGSDQASADKEKTAQEPAQEPAQEDADDALATLVPGKLTIATGNPAWPPWVIDDNPESGEGFEAAVAYAVAEQLGFAKEDVIWTRTDFDPAIQPGAKDFDFNLQQFSITPERLNTVDFSSPYYKEGLAVIVKKDGKFAKATSVAELKDAVFGAPSGDIAIQYTTDNIAPTKEVQVFNNLSDVFSALNSGQIDATVTALLTADYVINVEGETDEAQIENGLVLGKLAGSEDFTDGLALLLAKDSPLTAAVTAAVDALRESGKLAELADQWLSPNFPPDLK